MRPESAFYAHPRNFCKQCKRLRTRAARWRDIDAAREHSKALSRRRAVLGGNIGKSAVYQRANPEKRAAHLAVKRAVWNGVLVVPERCEECGKDRKVHAHHHDYGLPLDVRWLCPPCHAVAHGRVLGPP